VEQARKLRQKIDNAGLVASIPFVMMARAEQLDDVTITEHADIFPEWAASVTYAARDIVRGEGGQLYRCAQAHTAQAGWTPGEIPALWTKIGDPAEEWPEWSQPIGAHDAYQAGDKATYNGKRWISTEIGNVWAPGVYGWDLA
jgi:hypothetical protein